MIDLIGENLSRHFEDSIFTKCEWKITVRPGRQIEFKFEKFERNFSGHHYHMDSNCPSYVMVSQPICYQVCFGTKYEIHRFRP